MTAQGSSSSLGPLDWTHVSGFSSEWLLSFRAAGQSWCLSCLPQRRCNLPWEWALTLPWWLYSCSPIQFGDYDQSITAWSPTRDNPKQCCKRPELSSETSCEQNWWPPPWYLNMWGSHQLLTWDQNQQHFPVSHCSNLTHHHPGQCHPHWPPPHSLYHNLWCSQRPPQPTCHQGWL